MTSFQMLASGPDRASFAIDGSCGPVAILLIPSEHVECLCPGLEANGEEISAVVTAVGRALPWLPCASPADAVALVDWTFRVYSQENGASMVSDPIMAVHPDHHRRRLVFRFRFPTVRSRRRELDSL